MNIIELREAQEYTTLLESVAGDRPDIQEFANELKEAYGEYVKASILEEAMEEVALQSLTSTQVHQLFNTAAKVSRSRLGKLGSALGKGVVGTGKLLGKGAVGTGKLLGKGAAMAGGAAADRKTSKKGKKR